jgi:hypothetical protein
MLSRLLRWLDRVLPAHGRGRDALPEIPEFRGVDIPWRIDDTLAPDQWQVRDQDDNVLYDSHDRELTHEDAAESGADAPERE